MEELTKACVFLSLFLAVIVSVTLLGYRIVSCTDITVYKNNEIVYSKSNQYDIKVYNNSLSSTDFSGKNREIYNLNNCDEIILSHLIGKDTVINLTE